MRAPHFDLDALRSFTIGIELGSFAKAAERLNRSTSAVSAQLKKLEEQAGAPILRRAGRGLALTDAGDTLLAYARRLLELNDEAAVALRGARLEGWVRLGLQEDFGERLLADVLGRFARAHPRVRIEARIARNAELLDRLRGGQLDLALAWDTGERPAHGERLGEVPMRWIGADTGDAGVDAFDRTQPLPLVMLESPCLMRSAATAALDRAGLPWRLAFTSASLAGVWAAVSAGLGLSLRTPIGLPASVRMLDGAGLPALPALGLGLYRGEAAPPPAVARLAELLRAGVRDALSARDAAGPSARRRDAVVARE
ncbi:LysR substrate-binding domain-containing protein [Luteimonas aquatica]|uniref:LysR substrate-binding domain-containing protein n=1 Tax=Luteimonas aquatica TaxID=450364 RepID=UPI001F56006B|nr:LysR substrate-binding domain-containing protein [Luteimonas aquatica]